MNTRLLFLLLLVAGAQHRAYCQRELRGQVLDAHTDLPLAGASITLVAARQTVTTGTDGRFRLAPAPTDTVLVTYVGYAPQRLPVAALPGEATVRLVPKDGMLTEVLVNTGYQTLPKERATGSFTHIDGKLLDEVVAPTLLEKLEGITNGLQFDRRNMLSEAPADGATGRIRIRGVSTMQSSEEALVILDNFPYEGDLDAINPNDVASITVLRDAAAASIWGARAGNGVIVITTKRGARQAAPQLTMTSNLTIGDRPDLYADRSRLPSATLMEIEADLFANRRYQEFDQTPIPAYAELLIKKRDGLISEADFEAAKARFAQSDIREEALRHLYRPSASQQYAAQVLGGGTNQTYYLSAGYDRNARITIGDRDDRLTLLARHTFQAGRKLEIGTGIRYAGQTIHHDGIPLQALTRLSTYNALTEPDGAPAAVVYDYRLAYQQRAEGLGLLDWQYRPLEERDLVSFAERRGDLQLDGSAVYKPIAGLDITASYQYVQGAYDQNRFADAASYRARNLVNRFTQADGTRIVPEGAIRETPLVSESRAHSGRIVASYARNWAARWELSALGGAEIRQHRETGHPGFTLYGFNPDTYTGTNVLDYATPYNTRPVGTARIPSHFNSIGERTTRFLSYFGNAALAFDRRFTVSASLRWDASNLFGVKTNQKGVPLWSVGGAWQATDAFRFRATYGRSGNVNHGVSVYPTIGYGTGSYTQAPYAYLTSAGNPSLRWETVSTANLGMDFSLLAGRIAGSVEYFSKFASDLIGEDRLDPASGIVSISVPQVTNLVNYASLRTEGADIQLNTRNLSGKLGWQTGWLFSYTRNRVKRFNTAQVLNAESLLTANGIPQPGRPLDALYAFPWNGLDPETGRTLIYHADGSRATDYRQWLRDFPHTALVEAGVTAPPFAGSMRNTLDYAGLQLSATVTFKAGHVFRRTSMLPGGISSFIHTYHSDYLIRWQQPGDERRTVVPSMLPYGAPATANQEDRVFRASEALVTKGDHIRLQDVRLGYTLPRAVSSRIGARSIQAYGYLRNPGLLWRANDQGIDPDFASASYPAPLTTSFGLQIEF